MSGILVGELILWLIVVVLAGLACQVTWYLVQMMVFARMSPWRFLRAASDVMASTFSTASTGLCVNAPSDRSFGLEATLFHSFILESQKIVDGCWQAGSGV